VRGTLTSLTLSSGLAFFIPLIPKRSFLGHLAALRSVRWQREVLARPHRRSSEVPILNLPLAQSSGVGQGGPRGLGARWRWRGRASRRGLVVVGSLWRAAPVGALDGEVGQDHVDDLGLGDALLDLVPAPCGCRGTTVPSEAGRGAPTTTSPGRTRSRCRDPPRSCPAGALPGSGAASCTPGASPGRTRTGGHSGGRSAGRRTR